MLKRVISALVGILLLLVIYMLHNNIIFNIAVAIVSIIGLNEFYHAVRQKGLKPVEIIGYICCILLVFVGFVDNSKVLIPFIVLLMPALFFILSCISIFSNLKIDFNDIAITILGIIYVPLMFLFLMLTWYMKNGYYLIWFILGGAWITDSFAYLIGVWIGKHKFSKISPKKSIEGCIGGIIACSVFYGIYSYFLNTHFADTIGMELNIALMTVLGVFVSIISQIGDFAASAIKRSCGIKDYGGIMPGHGGILDRFDSIIMISPFVYFLFEFIIKGA